MRTGRTPSPRAVGIPALRHHATRLGEPSAAEGWILLESRHMPGPGCIADERGLPDPLTERMAHAIHHPPVCAREPRGAHTPIDVAVRWELPGAPPHVPDPEAVGNEARQCLLDRLLRLRRGSTPGAEQQIACDRPREGSRDHQREQCSRLHPAKDARLLPAVPLIAGLEATNAENSPRPSIPGMSPGARAFRYVPRLKRRLSQAEAIEPSVTSPLCAAKAARTSSFSRGGTPK